MYKCDNCEYTSKTFFGLCPRCKMGIGEKDENYVEVKKTATSVNPVEPYKVVKLDKNITQDKIVRTTVFKGFDKVTSMNGGFVEDQVIALGAQPGVGKSTLAAMIGGDDTLYISTEESENQLKSRFNRVNSTYPGDLGAITQLEAIMDAIEKSEKNFIIIDSLNNINNGLEGYVRQAQNVSKIVNTMKSLGKFGIIISQVAKGGEITGMNTLLHTVDTVMYLERSLISSNLILSSNKNRFGEIGSISMFEHTENGLVEILEVEGEAEPEIGTTYSDAKFGYRTFKIGIEALVAPSSMNFGLRKVNGVNLNRVQQILGILAVNGRGKINFSNKDVYVSISNGLSSSDPKLDLAIANSILSSLTGKKPRQTSLSGEISLNGRVKNNEMKHIRDLIDVYY